MYERKSSSTIFIIYLNHHAQVLSPHMLYRIMSIVAMKRKSVVKHGSNRSGKPPGGYWLPQGPFGKRTTDLQLSIENYGPVGFSLNGTHRNIGYVGKSMRMSKQGTPFRGVNPMGAGGCCGTYDQPLPSYNVGEVITLGDQYMYVKPSVLSNKGMLAKKYRYLYNGQYPNYIVKPIYTGNQTDSASQGPYIQSLSAENICVVGVNDEAKYVNHLSKCSPVLCYNTTSRHKYNTMTMNAPYTKTIKQPLNSSQYTLQIQKKCVSNIGELNKGRVNGNGAPCTGHVGPSPAVNYNP
jgi:hypothetical protein